MPMTPKVEENMTKRFKSIFWVSWWICHAPSTFGANTVEQRCGVNAVSTKYAQLAGFSKVEILRYHGIASKEKYKVPAFVKLLLVDPLI